MLSNYAIVKLGFVRMAGLPSDRVNQVWVFTADDTNLILKNELGSAMYILKDGRPTIEKEYWRGSLPEIKSLIRKLIRFGNNLKDGN